MLRRAPSLAIGPERESMLQCTARLTSWRVLCSNEELAKIVLCVYKLRMIV